MEERHRPVVTGITLKQLSNAAGVQSFAIAKNATLANSDYTNEFSLGGFRLAGADGAPSYEHGICTVHEVRLYENALSDTDLLTVYNTLATKWAPIPGALATTSAWLSVSTIPSLAPAPPPALAPAPPPASNVLAPPTGVNTIEMKSNSSTFNVWDWGCWNDSSNRIMASSDTMPNNWMDCGMEAARRGRTMWGVQAGNQCWIPRDNLLTPRTVTERTTRASSCKPNGDAWNMHI